MTETIKADSVTTRHVDDLKAIAPAANDFTATQRLVSHSN